VQTSGEYEVGGAVRETLLLFVDALADPVLLIGEGGAIHFANRACEELFGYSRAELTGMPVETVLGPAGSDSCGPVSAAVHRSGKGIPVSVSFSPVNLEWGPVVVARVRDATESKRSEDALLRAREQLATVGKWTGPNRPLAHGLVSRLFGLGLKLQAAALRVDGDSRERIEAVISELDDVVVDVRRSIVGVG
jgi:PAS domain-containing protein